MLTAPALPTVTPTHPPRRYVKFFTSSKLCHCHGFYSYVVVVPSSLNAEEFSGHAGGGGGDGNGSRYSDLNAAQVLAPSTHRTSVALKLGAGGEVMPQKRRLHLGGC